MRIPVWATLPIVAAAASSMPFAAHAQDTQQVQVAEQCLADLRAFSQRLNQEQFWITGWGARGAPPAGPAVAPGAAATPVDPAVAPGAAAQPVDPETGVVGPMATPWGTMPGGVRSPRTEVRALFVAAEVLARRGNQEGCEYLLSELMDTYEGYTSQLAEAGIDPAEITTWRQEQIALAEPVTELSPSNRLTLDQLTGSDVRNLQDESLGSVSDLVLNRNTGEILYVLVARGGFLGIGEDVVPVPWQQFRMAPGLNTLVLDITEAEMEAAPAIESEDLFNPDANPEQSRMVDEFWSGQTTG